MEFAFKLTFLLNHSVATGFSVAVNAAPNIFSPIKSTHRQASELETGLTGFVEDPELFTTDKQLKLSKH